MSHSPTIIQRAVLFLTLLASLLSPRAAESGCAGVVDPLFKPPSLPAFAAVPTDDGKIVIGSPEAVVRVNADGVMDLDFAASTGQEYAHWIFALARDNEGRWLLGGNFDTINSAPRLSLARLLASGQLDPAFPTVQDPLITNSVIRILTPQPDGKMIVAVSTPRDLNSVEPQQWFIARLNSDGSRDLSFNGSAPNQSVSAVTLQSDGKILVAGSFTEIGDSPCHQLCRLRPAGSLDESFAPSLETIRVSGITVLPDEKILIRSPGVRFPNHPNDQNDNPYLLARLNEDGSLDKAFSIAGYEIFGVGIQPDGKYVLTGNFPDPVSGATYCKRIFPDGAEDSSFATTLAGGPSNSYFGYDFVSFDSQQRILVGGGFAVRGGSRVSLARLLNDNSPCAPVVGFESSHTTLIETNGFGEIPIIRTGDLSVTSSVGVFVAWPNYLRINPTQTNVIFAPGVARQNLLIPLTNNLTLAPADSFRLYLTNLSQNSSFSRYITTTVGILDASSLNLPGSVDPTFAAPLFDASFGDTLIVTPDQKVVAPIARFPNGITVNPPLERINPDGSIDTTFHPLSMDVNKVIAWKDKFYAAGGFSTPSVIRLFNDGSEDAAFMRPQFLAPSNTTVFAALFGDSDGKVLVAGVFTNVNGTARSALVRFDTDGSLDAAFSPQLSPTNLVSAIAALPDGTYVIAGTLSFFEGDNRRLAHIDSTGALLNNYTLDDQIVPSQQASTFANCLAVQSDGGLLVGGTFYTGSDYPEYLIRFNSHGQFDASFHPTPHAFDACFQIVLQSNGKIIAAGSPWSSPYVQPLASVRRFNPDGVLDPTFYAPTLYATALALDAKENLYVRFMGDLYNGYARTNLVRLRTHEYSGPGVVEIDPDIEVPQNIGVVRLKVRRGWSTQGEARVRVKTTSLEAQPNIDYTPMDQLLVFADADGAEQEIAVPIIDQPGSYSIDKRLVVTLTPETPGLAVGTTTHSEITIFDNESAFQFTYPHYYHEEFEGRDVDFTISRVGLYTGPASVEVVTRGGTAIPGVDYDPILTTLQFDSPSNTVQTVRLHLPDDFIAGEAPRTVALILRNATGAVITQDSRTNFFTIKDLAEPFTPSPLNQIAVQNYGHVDLSIGLSYLSNWRWDQYVRIGYNTEGGTAKPDVEYVPIHGEIVFNRFETTITQKQLAIPLLQNSIVGDPTTIQVKFTVLEGRAVMQDDTATIVVRHPPAVVAAGVLDSTFVPIPRTNENYIRFVAANSNYIYLLGNWSDSYGPHRLARFAQTGVLDNTYVPAIDETTLQETGNLTLLSDGSLIFYGGANPLRLKQSGELDQSFRLQLPPLALLNTIVAAEGGKMIVSAGIQFAGAPYLSQFLSDGSPDPSFKPVTFASAGTLTAVRLQRDGRIVIAGGFNDVHGIPRPGLARILPDGDLDLSFAPPSDIFKVIRQVFPLSNGENIIVGADRYDQFTSSVRLAPDGSRAATQNLDFVSGQGLMLLDIDQLDRSYVLNFDPSGSGDRFVQRILPTGELDAAFMRLPESDSLLVTPTGLFLLNAYSSPLLSRYFIDPPTALRAPELLPNNRIAHTFNFPANTPYILEQTADFQTWTELLSGTSAEGYVHFETDAPTANQFYRVRSK